MKSIFYEEACSRDLKGTNEAELKLIDPKPLEDSLSTLARLQKEHFPDQFAKDQENFRQRADALKNRLNPTI